MKKLMAILLTVVMMLGSVSAFASYDPTGYSNYGYNYNNYGYNYNNYDYGYNNYGYSYNNYGNGYNNYGYYNCSGIRQTYSEAE